MMPEEPVYHEDSLFSLMRALCFIVRLGSLILAALPLQDGLRTRARCRDVQSRVRTPPLALAPASHSRTNLPAGRLALLD